MWCNIGILKSHCEALDAWFSPGHGGEEHLHKHGCGKEGAFTACSRTLNRFEKTEKTIEEGIVEWIRVDHACPERLSKLNHFTFPQTIEICVLFLSCLLCQGSMFPQPLILLSYSFKTLNFPILQKGKKHFSLT